MSRILLVALRDYRERVRSRGFIVTILIVPIMIVASVGVPMLLDRAAGPTYFALFDLPERWSEQLQDMINADEDVKDNLKIETTAPKSDAERQSMLEDLRNRVRTEKLYGIVAAETLEGGDRTASITTRTSGTNDGLRWLRRNLPTLVRVDRAGRLGLDPDQTRELYAPVDIKPYILSLADGKSKEASDTDRLAAFAPMIFTYLLWLTTFTLVQQLLMSTLEEKTNRTIEVILSSVSPMEFMAGKVTAGVLEGLTILAAWLGTLWLFAGYLSQHYLKGIDLTILFANKANLVFFSMYFALGFILFASMTVGLGSLCSTIRETQGLMTPVMVLMVVPILAMSFVGENPNSPIAVVMSYIPFFTPFLMMNRIAATPPPHWIEIVLATSVLLGAIFASVWAGAKLFRIGVLMYGKPPKIGEVIRLLRSPQSKTM